MATRRKTRKKLAEPLTLARVFTTVSSLPDDDTIKIAALWRLQLLLSQAGQSTRQLAKLLGTTVRSAQRIRRAYGLVEEVGFPPRGSSFGFRTTRTARRT